MIIDWNEMRKEKIPNLKNLIYIMIASASMLCKNAYEKGMGYFNDMYHSGDIYFEENSEKLNKLREMVAEYINI